MGIPSVIRTGHSSSFHRYVERGIYAADWGAVTDVAAMELE